MEVIVLIPCFIWSNVVTCLFCESKFISFLIIIIILQEATFADFLTTIDIFSTMMSKYDVYVTHGMPRIL